MLDPDCRSLLIGATSGSLYHALAVSMEGNFKKPMVLDNIHHDGQYSKFATQTNHRKHAPRSILSALIAYAVSSHTSFGILSPYRLSVMPGAALLQNDVFVRASRSASTVALPVQS